jgi:hypothetical protein
MLQSLFIYWSLLNMTSGMRLFYPVEQKGSSKGIRFMVDSSFSRRAPPVQLRRWFWIAVAG